MRVLLALLIGSVLLSPLRRELYVGDETKYAQVVRELRAGANPLLPTLHARPFTHKPPLHFWAITVLTYIFGFYSVWPFVIPSIVAFAALLWLVWRMAGPDASHLAAFVCGTSLMVWGSAQSARMDVGFTALIAAGAWFVWWFFERDDFRALLLAALALAFATLLKGPMAPVIGIVLFALEARARRRVPRGNYVVPILTLIVIPLLWLVPAIVMGGGGFAHDVLVKQTAGRAIGAWVHKSPPWFYLTHAPATLFPWFLLLVAAIVAIYRRGGEPDPFGHFCVRWILAVLVPYSLLSSKLDVYMMAMIPPVAIVIARFATTPADDVHARWGRRVNAIMMIVLLAVGAAGVLLPSTLLRPADREIASQTSVRLLFAVLAIAALIALIVAARQRTVTASTIALGLVPLAALIYAATALVPLANTFASARPLVAGLARLDIPPEQIALFTCPQLWTRDMPRSLERVRYVDADAFRDPHFRPLAIATSRRYAADIGPALGEYRRVDQVQMIGKWFDVYRR